MTRLDEAVNARLAEIHSLVRSGATEMTGKSHREYEGGKITGRYGGGFTKAFPELERSGVSPSQAASAIERGKGKVYARLRASVREELREHVKETRRRIEKPTVPPHEAKSKRCKTCHVMHGKGQHRFHGEGAFHRTHLFAFGGSRNPARKIRFMDLPNDAVFEFADEKMPRGPWRKVGTNHARLADYELQRKLYPGRESFHVMKSASVTVKQGDLFAGGPLFNPGRGRGFYFLGSATSKLAARRIEAKHPGSFIHEKNGRYYILKAKRIRSNPRKKRCNPPSKKLVRIYGRVLRIEAQKKGKHRCDAECRRCNHRYYHDFRKSNIKEYGLSPGQVFVVPPGKWPLLIMD